MGLLDRLFGRAPTMDKLVRDMARRLQARGAEDVRARPERGEIAYRLYGDTRNMFLANLLHDLQHGARAERPALIERFLESGLAPADAIPRRYEDAKARLMPIVRCRADIGLAALTQATAGDGDGDESEPPSSAQRPASQPLVGDLVVALVCDLPTAMVYVNEQTLAEWEVGFGQALDDALQNLRGLPEQGGWKQLGDGVWSGEWGDSYDSSRLLLPDLIHRVGVRDPVAVVPFRNALMLTGADNADGIVRMAKVIADAAGDNQRWLSFQLLRLQDTRWVAHAPLVAADAWHELRLRDASRNDEQQKQLLDALHERRKVDLWVASSQMLSRPDLGTLSFAIWSRDVDTLLPHTEFVLFNPGGEDLSATLLVPWDDAVAIAGELMEPTHHVPERRRVRRFPDDAQWLQLKGRALALG